MRDGILYAGHAGVSFNRFGPIWGFLPVAGDIAVSELLEGLKNGDAYPGRVDDDKGVFEDAASEGAEILTLEYHYPQSFVDEIAEKISEQQKGALLTYAWPDGNGDCNCVTWLFLLGLALPDLSGKMSYLVPSMKSLIASAPIVVEI